MRPCLLIVIAAMLVTSGCADSTEGPVAETSSTVAAAPESATPTAPAATSGLEWKPVLDDLGLRDPSSSTWRRLYATSFEQDSDLAGFYETPPSPMTRHGVVADAEHHSGARAHHGWLTGATGAEPVDGPNHRGYPAIQLAERPAGVCASPCLVDFWVRLSDTTMARGEWMSLATLSSDGSDRWSRVVTVNVGFEGWLHLFHVPVAGAEDRDYQGTEQFPRDRWVRVTTLIDFSTVGGAVAVWQDGKLMSAARVEGGDGSLDQLHLGLYAAPSMLRGSVWNDDIEVLTAR